MFRAMAPVPVSFRFPEEFVKRIDAARGNTPRTRFVERAIAARIEAQDEQRAGAESAVRT